MLMSTPHFKTNMPLGAQMDASGGTGWENDESVTLKLGDTWIASGAASHPFVNC